MQIKGVAAWALVAFAGLVPAFGQQSGDIAEIHVNHVKPGMTQQYEAGRKKHMAWHKSQNDAWSWYTWQVVTGPATGAYVVGSFEHNWKDMDGREKFVQADGADSQAAMGAALAGNEQSYYRYRGDMSLSKETYPPTAMLAISHFMVDPAGVNDFIEGVKKVNEGIKKTNYPQAGPSRWYQLVNGGEGPHFVLVGDRANWASFQPPDKSLDAMMEEAYGKEQGAAILSSLRKTLRSSLTEMLQYRSDLSYVAGK
ncbi:MAG TPA: hypothetical protein VHR84_13420 [Terriglobales bacterium]|jgi:hypothetical protein|nr:hypothetical protein [Terriglobales bacterium]